MMKRASSTAYLATYYIGDPSITELVFMVLNFMFCAPVLLCVGIFSLYHFYCAATNSTTIEGLEKDKVARLVKRGRIQEIKFPYHLGVIRNIRYIIGSNPLVFLFPQTHVNGDGLTFPIADGADPETYSMWPPKDLYRSLNPHRPPKPTKKQKDFRLPDSPWVYGGDSVNPALQPSNASIRRRVQAGLVEDDTTHAGTYNVPPYHSSFESGANNATWGRQSLESSSASASGTSDDDGYLYDEPDAGSRVHVRRGSEGWEVRPRSPEGVPISGTDRYNRYVPERTTSEEVSSEGDDDIM